MLGCICTAHFRELQVCVETHYEIVGLRNTVKWVDPQITQSGNGHFPSWWKNYPRLVRVGGALPTPFHYIFHGVQSCDVCSSWEGRFTPFISILPLFVLCGLIPSVKHQLIRCHPLHTLTPPPPKSVNFLTIYMGARNRVEIGLSYRPARLRRLAELIPWNRFFCSLKV
jgi:hypothetical protein